LNPLKTQQRATDVGRKAQHLESHDRVRHNNVVVQRLSTGRRRPSISC